MANYFKIILVLGHKITPSRPGIKHLQISTQQNTSDFNYSVNGYVDYMKNQ